MLNQLNFKDWNEFKNLLIKHKDDRNRCYTIINKMIKETHNPILKKLLVNYLDAGTFYELDSFYCYYKIQQD